MRIYRISSRGQLTRGGLVAWGLGEVLTTPHGKNLQCYELLTKSWTWIEPFLRRKQWKKCMSFGRWDLRSLYRLGSIRTVTRELAKYELDLVCVQKGNCRSMELYPPFIYRKGNENRQIRTGFFIHQRIILAVKIVEDFSD